jgi:hypothetical protein
LSNGGEYLFQAHDDDEMGAWVEAINMAAGGVASGSSGRAQTLPAGAAGGAAAKEKKTFFTLKKK